jgi:hypothetical protein
MTPNREHTTVFMFMGFPGRSIDEQDQYIWGYKRYLKFMPSEFVMRQFNKSVPNMRIVSEHDARMQPQIPGRNHREKFKLMQRQILYEVVIFWQVIQWYGASKLLGSSPHYFPLKYGSISSCRDCLIHTTWPPHVTDCTGSHNIN